MYYTFVKNDKINGTGQCRLLNEDMYNVEIDEEVYNNIDHYIAVKHEEETEVPEYDEETGEQTGTHTETVVTYTIELNPDYDTEQAKKREIQFKKEFFQTSLGWIRRKASMKTGEKKDFLTDLLPVIAMGVNSGQQVIIITYLEPDYTQEEVDWESLQTYKEATDQFIQECFLQVSKDFSGI